MRTRATARALRVHVPTMLLVVLAACSGPTIVNPFFPPLRDRNATILEPPRAGLLVWLEDGVAQQRSLMTDASGMVTRWADARGGTAGASAVPTGTPATGVTGALAGQRITANVTTPSGRSWMAAGLRCVDPGAGVPRCSYAYSPGGGATSSGLLDGSPYTILAVVRRNSSRDSNYFVNTTGTGCNPTFGTTCTSNTVLHLGWAGARAVRLGQYDRDVTLDPVPAFSSSSPPLTLIQGVSGPGTGKLVAVLEPGFNQAAIDPRVTALLMTSAGLFIGGSPFPGAGPDWHFTGDIFAILIYTRELSVGDLAVAQEYLRLRYGPA